MVGALAVVSEGAAGVELWDVSNASSPSLVGRVDARRADDAVVSGGQLIVADGLSGLLVDSLPAISALPAVQLVAPVDGAEVPAGTSFAATAAASGVGLDSVELLIDGSPVALMDELEPSARWTVPSWATPGSTFAVSARARSAAGQVVSASRTVRVTPASAAAPSFVNVNSIGSTFASGATIAVKAGVAGGLAPFQVRARFGATSLGSLAYDPSQLFPIYGTLRLPVLAADATDSLVLELVDGAGRTASWSTSITVKADAGAPSAPTGLPSSLRAGPYVNHLSLSASSAGAFTLRLLADGVVKGSVESQGGSATLALDLQLPDGSVGQSVTLEADAEDAAGRISVASQSYVVQVDGVPPVVRFDAGYPPASAPEGSPVHVQVVASDPDGDLASLRLYLDGSLVDTTTSSIASDFTLPLMTSEKTTAVFTAIATDSRGRTAQASATIALKVDLPPVLTFAPDRSLKAGETVQLCVKATDEMPPASLEMRVDNVPVASSLQSCGADCVQQCANEFVSLVSSVAVAAQATDVYGKVSAETRTYSIVATPPSVVLSPAPGQVSAGATVHLCAVATDDVQVRTLSLVVDNVNATGTPASCGAGCLQLCVDKLVPATGTFAAAAQATDNVGLTGSASGNYVAVGIPPTIAFSSPYPSLLVGETVHLCARATDDVQVASLEVQVDGVSLPGPAVSCGAACLESCTDKVVPAEASLAVVATAVDNVGLSTSGSKSYPVASNAPPVVTLNVPSYITVNTMAQIAAVVNDERPKLGWAEFRVNGTVIGSRIQNPTTGATLTVNYTPTTTGSMVVELYAQDSLGAVGSASANVPVTLPVEPALSTPVIAMDDFSYDGKDIVVRNATLRIDGHHAFKSIQVINNGVLTHSPNDIAGKFYMELEVAGAILVDTSSTIDVSGKGYLGGYAGGNANAAPRTQGNVLATQSNVGGSYGGYGSLNSNGSRMPVYGDYRDPNDLGSGGTGSNGSYPGGNGGGLVRLTATSLTLNGSILAKGSGGSSGYSGSGGGVRIDVGALTGTGSVDASGGSNSYSGGGGRIAVYYGSGTTFDLTKLKAQGWSNSGAGTVFTKDTSNPSANGALVIGNGSTSSVPTPVAGGIFDRFEVSGGAQVNVAGDLVATDLELKSGGAIFGGAVFAGNSGTMTIGAAASFNDLSVPGATGLSITGGSVTFNQPWAFPAGIALTVTNSGKLSVTGKGPIWLSTLSLTNYATLTHALSAAVDAPTATSESALILNVTGAATIDQGSVIDVSGKGYLGGYAGGNANAAPRTQGNVLATQSNVGGSYGGYGSLNSNGSRMPVYGDYRDPNDLGSGGTGSNGSYPGGNGGGLVRLTATSLTLNGSILAKGSGGSSGYSGSGGGVRIDVGALTGTGSVDASGGSNSYSGGGGRIAVYYGSGTTFDLTKLKAQGWSNSGAGTVFTKDTSNPSANGALVIGNGSTSSVPTPVAGGIFDRFEVSGGAQVNVAGDLVATDLELKSGGAIFGGAVFAGNSGTMTIGAAASFNDLSVPGATGLSITGGSVTFNQPWAFPAGIALTVTNSGKLSVTGKGPIWLSTLSLTNYATLTHALSAAVDAPTATSESALILNVTGAATIDQGSVIDVSGKGYLGGYAGGNANAAPRTQGNVLATQSNVGGSYGGYGSLNSNGSRMPVYGDYRDPNDLGSGGTGSNGSYPGGNGGGLVRLTATSLTLNGSILAKGSGGSSGYSGSGGGVRIDVGALTGTGSVDASGGSNSYSGGGGRIAVYYGSGTTFDLTKLKAQGWSNSGAGTVFTKDTSNPSANGALVIGNGSTSSVPTPVAGGIFDRFEVSGGAQVRVSGDLTAPSFTFANGTAEFDGAVRGADVSGLAINGGSVTFNQPWALSPDIALTISNSGKLSVAGKVPLALSSMSLTTSATLTHAESMAVDAPTATSESALILNVTGAATIDQGSVIDVSGKGYLGGYAGGNANAAPRTQGNVLATQSNVGGSYGGYGSLNSNGSRMPVYGDYRDPNDLGSGGTGSNGSYPGGNGGGLVRLTATSLTLNGSILAKGSGGSSGYSGSGGGVRIDVGALTGTGSVDASGGSNSYSGGGGRIAVYYGSGSTFDLTKLKAQGPSNSGAGTVFTKETSNPSANGALVIGGGGGSVPTPVEGGTFDRFEVSGGAQVRVSGDLTAPSFTFANGTAEFDGAVRGADVSGLAINGGSVTFNQPWALSPDIALTISNSGKLSVAGKVPLALSSMSLTTSATLTHAESMAVDAPTATSESALILNVTGAATIDQGSVIDVSGKGYLGGYAGGNANAAPRTQGNVLATQSNVGGSYGGYGSLNSNGSRMPVYGDYRDPNDLGSGGTGSNGSYPGGNGGGLVRLTATSLTLNGSILAKGSGGSSGYSGSGGGVRIDVGALTGTGSVDASGGGNSYSGGGGRIAVYYGSGTTFDLTKLKAQGPSNSGAGTVFTKETSNPSANGALVIGGGGGSVPTPVEGGTFDRFEVSGGAQVRVSGDLTAPSFTFANGTAEFDGAVRGADVSGLAINGGSVTFNQPWALSPDIALTISNSGKLSVAGKVPLALSSMSLTTSATLTHAESMAVDAPTATSESALILNVTGAATIDQGSVIDVSGKGYLGGYAGGNANAAPRTQGNVLATQSNVGGSYGGYGSLNSNGSRMPVYGDYRDPNDLGSGGTGSNGSYPGGNGGGLVRLTATSLTLNGSILAKGSGGSSGYSGSGGGVRIDVGALTGTGSVDASGGGNSYSGGGGRIAVYYGSGTTFDLTKLKAQGWSNSGAGTVFTQNQTQSRGDMRVDNRGVIAPSGSTPFAPTGTGELWFDNLRILGGAWMVTPDNLYLSPNGTLTVDSNAHLQSRNLVRP